MGEKKLSVPLQLAAGMAIFGSGTPVSKLVTEAFPVFLASGLRMLLAALLLLPFVLRAGDLDLRKLEKGDWLRVAAIALVGMFAFSVLMLYGMKKVSGTVGSVVMSTTPAVTALGAILFLSESVGWRRWTGIGLSVAGLLILHLGSSGDAGGYSLVGAALVFGAVCCEAAYTLLGKTATETLKPLSVACLSACLATPLFLPLALRDLSGFDWSEVTLPAAAALFWWGAGTMALGSVLWYRGVSQAEGSTAAGFMGVMPVSALLLSYLLLGDPFVWSHVVGFAVVLAGVLVISQAHAREGE